MESRYTGKPFLRLLECYVLWASGELGADDEQKLQTMTPKLCEVYQRRNTWQEIVTAEMDFPADLPDHIKAMWTANKQRADNNSVTLHAEDFARMFVDDNFDTR